MAEDLSWRLRVAGAYSGCGFAVTRTLALTCAHVIEGSSDCTVALLGDGVERCRPARPVAAYPGDERADIAVIDITGHVGSVAPMGAPARPRIGTTVSLLGLPTGDDFGRRARARISGTDTSGSWLQMDPLDGHTSRVDYGFSGGAALDEASGRVIGMVVASDRQSAAWLIPLCTIIDHLPWLARAAGDPLRADPDFVRFLAQLRIGRYAEAFDILRALEPNHRTASDTYYYWAIVMLGGYRPALHSAPTIEAVEKVLREACRLDPHSPHARALLALLFEDFYVRSALVGPRPDLTGIIEVSSARAEEIVQHVPAPECRVWQIVDRWR